MIGMTLCSGIGAPEVAAPWIDWRFAAEIEKFPRAVLQQRLSYKTPENHNQGDPLLWGDMTEVTPDLLREYGVPLPDLIVAGTPCQSFSIAGARKGLKDDRGNLTLAFVGICHAIVDARHDGKLAVVWENVPGVLSDAGNAFGNFLGAIVGSVVPVVPSEPPRKRAGSNPDHWRWHKPKRWRDRGRRKHRKGFWSPVWPSEGMVQGPRARAAWAILNAEFFGVAQRRRRLFVVVDFGDVCDPAAILLEPESLRGNPPTRGEAGEGFTAGTIRSTDGGSDVDHARAGHLVASTGDVSHCLNAGGMGRQDYETETLVTHALRGEGFDASEDGTGRGTPIVPVSVFDPNQVTSKTNRSNPTPELSHTLPGTPNAPVAFAIQERAVSENPDAGPQGKGWQEETGFTLETRNKTQAVAFRTTGNAGAYETGDITGALNTATDPSQHVVTVAQRGHFAGFQESDLSDPLRAKSGDQGGGSEALAVAFQNRTRGDDGRGYDRPPNVHEELTGTIETVKPWNIATPYAVRRLMPVETARLQGFPDDHTAIKYRGKPAADGPQYKGHGNSMAVPVMRYLLERTAASMGMFGGDSP